MNLGRQIWTVKWGEKNNWVFRLAAPLLIGMVAAWGWSAKVMHLGNKEWSSWVLVPGGLVAIAVFILLAPDRYSHTLGDKGFMLTLVRHGVIAKKWVILYADVDDVEFNYTRLVAVGNTKIYSKTEVRIGFLDRKGDVLIELEDTFHEPWQQANGWTPAQAVDLSLVDHLSGTNEARLGFDAHKAWKASKTIPHDGVYR